MAGAGTILPHAPGSRLHARPPALLWLPGALVAGVALLPIAYLVLRTATAGAEAWHLLLRPRTLELLLNTAGLALAVTAAATALAVPLAWLTVRTDLPARRAWALVTALPLVIPSYVGGFVLVAALGPRGLAQQFLAEPFGVQRLPEVYGFPGAWLALTLFTYPYVLLTVRGTLQGMDPALEEAARTLGCGPWESFRRVTLPHLKPAIASGGLLVALYTISDFGVVSLLQFDSLTRAIYLQYQASFDRILAAAFSLILVGVAGLVLAAEGLTRGHESYHPTRANPPRLPRPRPLGRWLIPSLLLCALVALLSLGLPVAVLIYWLVRGLAQGQALQLVWAPALNSVYASGLAALACAVAALPVAILSVRHPHPVTSLLERATYAGFALPGIVIALALVFFGANFATPLYQTMALLILAYLVRFLPQAVGAARTSLQQISPTLEEAAQALGRSPRQVAVAVTVPLALPGILSGAGLVFLTTMKELPATLLLSPIGFKTLATSIWSGTSEGLFAQAAAPALMLVAAAALPLYLLGLQERRSEA